MRYRVEVRRLGFLAYGWEVFSTSATSRLPLWHGVRGTKRGALRSGLRRAQDADPVIVREVP